MIRPVQVLIGFTVVAFLIYFPTIGAGFVYDFLGWQKQYENGSFRDIIHSFGYNGNHQLLHLVFYSFYKVFHISGIPWYIFFTSLHVLNAWLIYFLLSNLNVDWNLKASHPLIIGVAGLFLINPYTIEPVVWKVCVHYLLSLMAVVSIFLLQRKYIFENEKSHLYWLLIIYFASLFLLELAFVTPLCLTAYFLLMALVKPSSNSRLWRMGKVTAFCWGILGLYLVLNKLTLLTWVGHYGEEQHLSFDLLAVFGTEVKYFIKRVFFARFLGFHAKEFLFDKVLSNSLILFTLLTVVLSLFMYYLIQLRKWKPGVHVAVFGLLGSVIFTLPVSNLFFYHLHVGMNDRYDYIPICFLLIGIFGLLSMVPLRVSLIIMILVGSMSLFQSYRINQYWKQSSIMVAALRDKFHWHDKNPVFVLNSPDNYKGIVMTSIIFEPSGIDELLDYQSDRPFEGEMYDVFQINMNSLDEGVTVEQTGPMQLLVRPKQWGNWWHRNGIGASNYENEYYKAELLDYPYQLTFKQLPPNSVIIYQDGLEWKEFKME